MNHQSNKVLNTNLTYNAPSSYKSVQWTAFYTLSTPNLALKLFGSNFLAIYGSNGPHNFLNCSTACYCLTYKTIDGPDDKCSTNLLHSGKNLYAS